jgi:DNA-binding transcriptional LysR family regulator
LLQRSTRRIALTEEGQRFMERCQDSVTTLEDVFADLGAGAGTARGHVRISAHPIIGRREIAPLLARFREHYPGITVELMLGYEVTDLIGERIDIGIRIGVELPDSSLIVRPLFPVRLVTCAAPGYLANRKAPVTVADLRSHACTNFRYAVTGRIWPWEFKYRGRRFTQQIEGVATFSDIEAECAATLAGMGISQLPGYLADEPLAAGRLVPVLKSYAPDPFRVYLCYPSRPHLPQRTRAVIDFLCAHLEPSRKHLLQAPACESDD